MLRRTLGKGHEKVDRQYLSILSYSVGQKFLKSLTAVGMKLREENLESLPSVSLFSVKEALVIAFWNFSSLKYSCFLCTEKSNFILSKG